MLWKLKYRVRKLKIIADNDNDYTSEQIYDMHEKKQQSWDKIRRDSS